MNFQLVHYITLVCGALAAGLPQTAEAFPESSRPWFRGAAAIFVLLTAVLGSISPSALGAKPEVKS